MALGDNARILLMSVLGHDGDVFFTFNTAYEGVKIPEYLYKQSEVMFEVGYSMAVPIPDLLVDDKHISCTLSFNGLPFFCIVPLAAITGVHTVAQIRSFQNLPPEPVKKSNIVYLDEYRKTPRR